MKEYKLTTMTELELMRYARRGLEARLEHLEKREQIEKRNARHAHEGSHREYDPTEIETVKAQLTEIEDAVRELLK